MTMVVDDHNGVQYICRARLLITITCCLTASVILWMCDTGRCVMVSSCQPDVPSFIPACRHARNMSGNSSPTSALKTFYTSTLYAFRIVPVVYDLCSQPELDNKPLRGEPRIKGRHHWPQLQQPFS